MSINVRVDLTSLKSLSESIEKVPKEISDSLVRAVNTVARATFETSKKKIVEQVNLQQSYVDSKLKLEPASDVPTATITGQGRGVLLSNFNPVQLTKANVSSRGKGNPKLGIPKGYRAAGVKVRVKAQGSGGDLQHGFFMKLKNGNGMGVFTRNAAGRVQVRYGPSVDQIFSGVSTEISPEVERDLSDELIKELEKIRI